VDTGGVVTIMHVDVEGSTRLTTTEGDEVARVVLAETKSLVRELVEAAGGREIDAVGDAMMLTFISTRSAITGAMAVQEAIAARESERPEDTLRVRIGLNAGEVLERDGRPFGAAVNAGARVMSYADGGEILVSELVKTLAGTVPGVTYKDRGRHAFKGWDEPWRLFQIVWAAAPAPRARKREPSRRRWWIVAGVAVLVGAAIVAAVAIVTSGGSGTPSLESLPRNSVGHIDPATDVLDRVLSVPAGPAALASHGRQLWVASADAESVTRIDEPTGRQTTIPVNGHPTAIVADANGAWVAELPNRKLERVDAAFGHVTETLPVAATALALDANGLWDTVDGTTVERRDPATGKLHNSRLLDLGATQLALTGSTLWVGASSASVQPLDPNRLIAVGAPIGLAGAPVALATSGNSLWAVTINGSVQAVNTQSAGIDSTTAVPNATSIAPTAGQTFVGVPSSGTVVHLGAGSHADITIGATPEALVADSGGVWVAAS
jgi:class 3 adenylate cyclase